MWAKGLEPSTSSLRILLHTMRAWPHTSSWTVAPKWSLEAGGAPHTAAAVAVQILTMAIGSGRQMHSSAGVARTLFKEGVIVKSVITLVAILLGFGVDAAEKPAGNLVVVNAGDAENPGDKAKNAAAGDVVEFQVSYSDGGVELRNLEVEFDKEEVLKKIEVVKIPDNKRRAGKHKIACYTTAEAVGTVKVTITPLGKEGASAKVRTITVQVAAREGR